MRNIYRARTALSRKWVRRLGKKSHPHSRLFMPLHMLFGLLHLNLFALVSIIYFGARVSFSRLQDSLFARPNVCLAHCTWWKSPLMRPRRGDGEIRQPETFLPLSCPLLFTDPRTHGSSVENLFSAVQSSHFYWMRLLSGKLNLNWM